MDHYSISFAGAGRVAGALCREMFRAGFKILQIVSENNMVVATGHMKPVDIFTMILMAD